MNVYKALNDLEIDLTEFDVTLLTSLEKHRIKKIAVKKLKLKRNWAGLQVGAAAVLAVGLVSFNSQTIANMPFVAGLLEQWNQEEQLDWTPYKTVIGEASETTIGKMTLNEVIIDYDSVWISSTFEKVDGFDFSYLYQISPTLYINGEKVETFGSGMQSIERNSSMFSIYNEVKLKEPIQNEQVNLEIVFDRIHSRYINNPEGEALQEPWSFNASVSQGAVQAETVIKEPMQTIMLGNGESIVIEKIVLTPISTTIYYSGFDKLNELDVNLYLVDAFGNEYSWNTGNHDDTVGIFEYKGANFVGKQLFVQQRQFDGTPMNELIEIQ